MGKDSREILLSGRKGDVITRFKVESVTIGASKKDLKSLVGKKIDYKQTPPLVAAMMNAIMRDNTDLSEKAIQRLVKQSTVANKSKKKDADPWVLKDPINVEVARRLKLVEVAKLMRFPSLDFQTSVKYARSNNKSGFIRWASKDTQA